MFQVDPQKDLAMRHIYGSTKNASPNNIPEWLDELLQMILQSMFTRSQIDEIILGWWPKRDQNHTYRLWGIIS
jgi:predicted Zn-dependent peptidase